MFSFFKKKVPEIKEKGPSVKSKGLDKSQISIDSIIAKEIPNDKLNIVIMDDDSFMAMSVKRDINQLRATIDGEEFPHILDSIRERYGQSVVDDVIDFSITFNINNYNITSFTGSKCGFEVLKTLDNLPKGTKIDYAVLDIVLGGIVIDENEMFVSVDGLDVTRRMLDIFDDHINILISTGCSMKDSKEEYKLNNLIGDRTNVNIYIKGLDFNVRVGDLLVLLSGERIESRNP